MASVAALSCKCRLPLSLAGRFLPTARLLTGSVETASVTCHGVNTPTADAVAAWASSPVLNDNGGEVAGLFSHSSRDYRLLFGHPARVLGRGPCATTRPVTPVEKRAAREGFGSTTIFILVL